MKIKLNSDLENVLRQHPGVQNAIEQRVDAGVAKAKLECPVETGRARDSIHKERTGEVEWKIVGGGPGVDYFEYVEYGTRHDDADHPLLKAIDAVRTP